MSDNPWNQIPFDQLPPDIQRSIITRRTLMQQAQREADAAIAALPPMNSEGGHGHE